MRLTIPHILEDFGLDDTDTDRATAAAVSDALQADEDAGPEMWQAASRRLKFFHGTAWETAQKIQRDGFEVSEDGCLGRGVYVARHDKALRFAQNGERHGGAAGGLEQMPS